MPIEIVMPHLGITMEFGTITAWLKHEGDPVEKGEEIVEFETDKINNVIESPVSGTITQILFPEGEEVKCGVPIARIRASDEAEAPATAAPELPGIPAALDLPEKTGRPETPATSELPPEWAGRKIREVIPMVGARKKIDLRMRESLASIPQATSTCRANVSGLLDYKRKKAAAGEVYTFTDLLIKAVAIALQKNPLLNAALIENKIYLFETINIGVAVALDRNLLVPVIHDVQDKNLAQISSELRSFAERAKSGTITGGEVTGATFTISNLGQYNVDYMTPIINPPEAAILGVGKYRKELVYNQSRQEFEPADMLPLSLTINHAIIDGAPAAQFLEILTTVLGAPTEYLDT